MKNLKVGIIALVIAQSAHILACNDLPLSISKDNPNIIAAIKDAKPIPEDALAIRGALVQSGEILYPIEQNCVLGKCEVTLNNGEAELKFDVIFPDSPSKILLYKVDYELDQNGEYIEVTDKVTTTASVQTEYFDRYQYRYEDPKSEYRANVEEVYVSNENLEDAPFQLDRIDLQTSLLRGQGEDIDEALFKSHPLRWSEIHWSALINYYTMKNGSKVKIEDLSKDVHFTLDPVGLNPKHCELIK